MAIFFTIFKRELLIAYRHGLEILYPLLFFALIVILFPLTMPVEIPKLQTMAPGILWISFLFASSLSIENLFLNDFEDGTLEQFILSGHSMLPIVFGKITAHWIKSSVPLMLLTLILSPVLYLSFYPAMILIATFMLGTPVISFLGSVGAALTLGLKNRSILLMLLICPLYIPVLIFGTGALSNALQGISVISPLAFLAAMFTATFTFAPLAIVGALRISVEC